MVKYAVFKQGKRGFTMISIHPRGRLPEARSNAIYTANKERCNTIVCQVLEEHKPTEGILIREKKDIHQERATKEGISREEAKTKTMAENYGANKKNFADDSLKTLKEKYNSKKEGD